MAKSLKSLLSKINFVDLAVVLVLVAVSICLMNKMNIVEGLCLGTIEENDEKCNRMNDDEELCEDRTTCRWIDYNSPINQCKINRRLLQDVGLQNILNMTDADININPTPLHEQCVREGYRGNCGTGGYAGQILQEACCLEDPNRPGECVRD